jgi:hypothetical protein
VPGRLRPSIGLWSQASRLNRGISSSASARIRSSGIRNNCPVNRMNSEGVSLSYRNGEVGHVAEPGAGLEGVGSGGRIPATRAVTRSRPNQAHHHLDRGGLARGVGTQHAEELAARDGRRDPVHRVDITEMLHQVLELDHRMRFMDRRDTGTVRRGRRGRFPRQPDIEDLPRPGSAGTRPCRCRGRSSPPDRCGRGSGQCAASRSGHSTAPGAAEPAPPSFSTSESTVHGDQRGRPSHQTQKRPQIPGRVVLLHRVAALLHDGSGRSGHPPWPGDRPDGGPLVDPHGDRLPDVVRVEVRRGS